MKFPPLKMLKSGLHSLLLGGLAPVLLHQCPMLRCSRGREGCMGWGGVHGERHTAVVGNLL